MFLTKTPCSYFPFKVSRNKIPHLSPTMPTSRISFSSDQSPAVCCAISLPFGCCQGPGERKTSSLLYGPQSTVHLAKPKLNWEICFCLCVNGNLRYSSLFKAKSFWATLFWIALWNPIAPGERIQGEGGRGGGESVVLQLILLHSGSRSSKDTCWKKNCKKNTSNGKKQRKR